MVVLSLLRVIKHLEKSVKIKVCINSNKYYKQTKMNGKMEKEKSSAPPLHIVMDSFSSKWVHNLYIFYMRLIFSNIIVFGVRKCIIN